MGLNGDKASAHVTLHDAADNAATRIFQLGGYGRYRNHGSRFAGDWIKRLKLFAHVDTK